MARIGHRPESGFNSSKCVFRIRVGTLIWVQLEGKLQIIFPARFPWCVDRHTQARVCTVPRSEGHCNEYIDRLLG